MDAMHRTLAQDAILREAGFQFTHTNYLLAYRLVECARELGPLSELMEVRVRPIERKVKVLGWVPATAPPAA